MRILITGAGGFIGRHLVERRAGEHALFALVRRRPATVLPNVVYVEQDLRQPLDQRQLPDELDAIVHQAALIDPTPGGEAALFQVNVVATWELLQYAQASGVRSFVHASTGGVYGCRNQPFVEEDPFNPMDLYSLTKAQAELAVRAAPGEFQRAILRYFFPYGPGTPNPIPRWVQGALTGEPLAVTPNGKPVFNPLHIRDAVEATVRGLQLTESTTLNIAGNEETTFARIAELAAAHVGRRPNLVIQQPEAVIPYYRADLLADTARMRRVLNFTPTISLADGIAELAEALLSASRATNP
ncbi:MAG TPA: NAD(P)-dependent oxidoreductase [Caldilineaceae bacterium]|nr:NAD(P)-dependent oxidoreductase [Caldilineaceae bacterium]